MSERKVQILRAAEIVFSRYGVSKTTMNDIAKTAGVARQTLYNEYPNKESVLRATLRFGAEKTMAAMAIRLALLSVSSLPKSDLFILDEPGTALDEENMEGFIRILELIKVYFKNVLLISHLDSLKDCVDRQIVIEKKRGYARVNQ